MGSLIRVFSLGALSEHGGSWQALIEKETNFWIFFPVAAALKQQLIRKITHCDVPERAFLSKSLASAQEFGEAPRMGSNKEENG